MVEEYALKKHCWIILICNKNEITSKTQRKTIINRITFLFFFLFCIWPPQPLRKFPTTVSHSGMHAWLPASARTHTHTHTHILHSHTHPPSLCRFGLLYAHLPALYVNQKNPLRTSVLWNLLSVLSRSVLTIAVQYFSSSASLCGPSWLA